MCIIFFYLNPDSEEGKFKLIIASNRDEIYTRPTKPAAFWEDNPDCISGIDLMSEREGGTWFGVSKKGRIGVLLNILLPSDPDHNKKGRGHLVTNYLTTGSSAAEYLKQFEQSGPEYNKFNLLLFDLNSDEKLHYFSNDKDECGCEPKVLPSGIYGVSNSVLDKPFQKTCKGKERFTKVVEECNSKEKKSELFDRLWDLMADRTSFTPDEQMLKQGLPRLVDNQYHQRAAVYVDSSAIKYGTRTTTLFTLDHSGKCEYLEKTMREPIDALNPTWDLTQHSFSMDKTPTTSSMASL